MPTLREYIDRIILDELARQRGNVSAAARELEVARSTVQRAVARGRERTIAHPEVR